MNQKLTGPDLIAYLRDNPTSDVMRAAANEIESLYDAIREVYAESLNRPGTQAWIDALEAAYALTQGES